MAESYHWPGEERECTPLTEAEIRALREITLYQPGSRWALIKGLLVCWAQRIRLLDKSETT
ncbi:MAG: hypothetical protein ACOYD6_09415 [Limnochordia bacterium]|jgi:hypothetical protein